MCHATSSEINFNHPNSIIYSSVAKYLGATGIISLITVKANAATNNSSRLNRKFFMQQIKDEFQRVDRRFEKVDRQFEKWDRRFDRVEDLAVNISLLFNKRLNHNPNTYRPQTFQYIAYVPHSLSWSGKQKIDNYNESSSSRSLTHLKRSSDGVVTTSRNYSIAFVRAASMVHIQPFYAMTFTEKVPWLSWNHDCQDVPELLSSIQCERRKTGLSRMQPPLSEKHRRSQRAANADADEAHLASKGKKQGSIVVKTPATSKRTKGKWKKPSFAAWIM